jgi:hypothetical protein
MMVSSRKTHNLRSLESHDRNPTYGIISSKIVLSLAYKPPSGVCYALDIILAKLFVKLITFVLADPLS